MRLLFATHNYPRRAGDHAGSFVATLAVAAAARGDEVVVVAPHAAGAAPSEVMDGVRVVRFRYAPDWAEVVAYRGDLHQRALRDVSVMFALPSFLAAFRRTIRRTALELRPDVVHAHWWFPAGWLATGTSARLIITCHGSDVHLLDRRIMRLLARQTLSRATTVSTVSTFLANRLVARLGAAAGDPIVTPLPVDPLPFERASQVPKASPPRILFAGNMVRSKGVDVLVAAAALLARQGHDFTLKLLGDGPLRSALAHQATRLEVMQRIEWGTFVAHEQMPPEYAQATVTVLPSVGEEGLGLTLVESLLAGTPVVGTAQGGIVDVIRHEQTGLLAQAGDSEDLARQLSRMLTNAAERNRLAAAGRSHVLGRHAPENALRRFFAQYDGQAGSRPVRPTVT